MFQKTKELGFEPMVSMRRLERLVGFDRTDLRRIADRAGRYYKPFDRRRNADDKWRHIDNPTEILKAMQSHINTAILRTVPFQTNVVGGLRGRSIKDNAEMHLVQPTVVTLDIKNFFPSVKDLTVFKVFRYTLGYSAEIASLLTKLTTFQHRLPQGAPTSSVLANLVLLPLHRQIEKIAFVYGLRWSVYVDDIAFSGERAEEAIRPAMAALTKFRLTARSAKVKVMRAGAQQKITGVVVNRDLSVGRGRVEEIRSAIIEISARDGEVFEHELARVRGQISYVASINAAQGESLKRLAARLLPAIGTEGARPAKGETRRCRSFARHRVRGISS